MRLKDFVLLFVMIVSFPLLAVAYTYLIAPAFDSDKYSEHISMSNEEQLIEDNFDPGKKAAYQNAKRYLSYAKDGSGFSAKSIRLELEAMGYSESEIAYAINKIPEETFVNQIVKMWKSYKEQGQILSKIDAFDRWRPLGFSKKEINEAFKIIDKEELK